MQKNNNPIATVAALDEKAKASATPSKSPLAEKDGINSTTNTHHRGV